MGGFRTKPPRLPGEDAVGGPYVEKLRAMGPREGETRLAFEIRLAGIAAGRALLIEEIRSTGDHVAAFRRLGINSGNITTWMRRLGFLPQELSAIPVDNLSTGIPNRSL